MEIKGIDVSAWQKNINWETAANYGMGFAILRITEAGNVTDKYFEKNYEACQEHNIPTGVYKYSYAMTIPEIESEAQKIISVLAGRKLQFPVWLDLEWNNQRALGAESLHKMTEAFEKIIVKAGYKFGIYCNVDWYENVICSHLKKYEFWVARYPQNDNGTLQERLRPDFGVGWQYSSKAKIPGISGTVDRNVFYKDYAESKKQEGGTDVDKAIEKVILIAKNEEGYLEKKSNNQLDDKTANAGSANYTKYWRDIKPDYQGQPWCAAFISWCFMKAFGLDNAKKLLKHWPYVYCPTLGKLFARNANPKIGDVVIFYHNGMFTHTGLVTAVIGDRFYTIEGNTSGASGIIANGGGVCAKSYLNSQMPGTKFCTPDYSIVPNAVNKPSDINKIPSNTIQTGEKYMFNPETVKAGDKNTSVLLLQEILRARGFKGKNGKALKLTWTADANTIYALKAYQESRKEVLEVDGICGPATWKDLIAI
jgi:GH25 family lysozyme M1 (1,4-beta-N-acetylmuramidase)